MSLTLEPMTQRTFDKVYEKSIHEYAHEHIKAVFGKQKELLKGHVQILKNYCPTD